MARTKAHQAAEVAPQLYQILEKMDPAEPLHAWMVTHVTQAADMLQDVLAALKEQSEQSEVEPVKETDFEPTDGSGEEVSSRTMSADNNPNGAL
jgi:hypothetical protein